ncbi:hypothetical protein BM221_003118 [Beauveria bassiana]|uniref:Uncharacterized protein n=1 Tax=Beauveria bassiana TaxID=176275 RepID=A0A2N6NTR5_BEABA|nr:hypothetical protein BM221_003118 [Beauveria bassiana]
MHTFANPRHALQTRLPLASASRSTLAAPPSIQPHLSIHLEARPPEWSTCLLGITAYVVVAVGILHPSSLAFHNPAHQSPRTMYNLAASYRVHALPSSPGSIHSIGHVMGLACTENGSQQDKCTEPI